MPDFIDFNISGMDKISEKLAKLPDAIGDAGVEQANNYILNLLVRKEVPQRKHVSRAEAYPGSYAITPLGKRIQGYQSWAQFQKVMSMYRAGKIPYKRRGPSGGVQSHWSIVGSGRAAHITNDDPAAKWLYSEDQARLNQLVGWRRISQILDKYTKNIIDSFGRGVATAIKKLGL